MRSEEQIEAMVEKAIGVKEQPGSDCVHREAQGVREALGYVLEELEADEVVCLGD